jgi:hypothetical protein
MGLHLFVFVTEDKLGLLLVAVELEFSGHLHGSEIAAKGQNEAVGPDLAFDSVLSANLRAQRKQALRAEDWRA